MKILVTGANGYIGLHIVKTLLDKGIQVIACDLNTDEVDKRAERKNIDLFTLPDTNIYTFFLLGVLYHTTAESIFGDAIHGKRVAGCIFVNCPFPVAYFVHCSHNSELR